MFKNIFLVIFLVLIIVLGAASGIFGYLYFNKVNEYNNLLATSLEQNNSENTTNNAENSSGNNSDTQMIKFQDISLDINLEYPSTWKLALDTKVSDDFAYDPVYGRIIQQYKATLTKGSSVVTFEKILGAVDGFPNKIKPASLDYLKVNDKLVRYKQSSETKWKYVQLVNCDDVAELFTDSVSSDEVCVSTFYDGFGNYANISYVTPSSELDLTEADQIAVSALNN